MNTKKINPDRLNALSDGVIAIAITLLVLGIDIPDNHDFNQEGLLSFLVKLEPGLTAYLTSFIVVAMYWIIHHRIFGALTFIDRTIMILNIAFLFFISLAPFIAKLKALYRYDLLVVGIFALAQITTGLILYATWKFAVRQHALLKSSIDRNRDRHVSIRILIIPIVSIFAAVTGFFNIHLGTYVFIGVPIVYLFLMDSRQAPLMDQPTSRKYVLPGK